MNETMKTILNRRSTRVFGEGNVKEEDIRTIMEAAVSAPSSMNTQSWHFSVIQNKEILNKLSEDAKNVAKCFDNEHIKKLANNEKFNIFYNAPVAIIVSAEEKAYESEINCAIASQNILLAAESLNLASCWIGFVGILFQSQREEDKSILESYKEKLGIPEGFKPLHAIILGQKNPNASGKATEKRADTVTYVK
ncbi:nitroreductase family protein [uncultured Clostridium sp.]|uniref:nitroreductase family protein n=1 Tax=uncultured Clostridium sp. TaxID=59620 RepID=UPI0026317057|nr:nitroreductase family protein [uncultured Clostridium sp.]